MSRGLLVAVALATLAALAGCLGDAGAPSARPFETAESAGPSNATLSTTDATTARTDCYGEGIGGVPCFEASVAVDPEGRTYAAVSVCQKIARSADGGRTYEALALPSLPPTAPPTKTVPGDCTVQIGPDGSLWFSAFYFQDRPADPPGVSVPNHHGIQVARSDDGGESWSVNTWVAKASRNPSPGIHPDRQWLSFGDGDRVYLTFWNPAQTDANVAAQSWIAVSEDGGASFGPFRPMPGFIPGDPVAQGDGILHVPYLDGSGDGYSVHVSTTRDGGATFEVATVHDATSGARVWWPDLAEGPEGRLYITWTDGEDVYVAREDGDGGWTDPIRWNRGVGSSADAAPGMAIHDGLLDVVWYRQDGDAQSYVLGRAPLGAWNASAVETHVVDRFNASKPVTHFADMAVDTEGRAVFGWTDPDQGLLLARETGGGGAG